MIYGFARHYLMPLGWRRFPGGGFKPDTGYHLAMRVPRMSQKTIGHRR